MKRALSTLIALLVAGGAAIAADKPAAKDAGAKGMYYEQLENPTQKLNNGIQYWIELKRNGQNSRVNNKFEFKSGDEIKFHVRANTDGYAYVVLREGSRGEHAVLFPDRRHADDNRIRANTEVAIPGDGFMQFDAYPGTERVTLILARSPIDSNKYIPDSNKDKVIIASRVDGSKDLVPGSFVVSYGGNDSLPMAPTSPGARPSSTTPVQHTSPPVQVIPPANGADESDAIITVVQKNPADALTLEICLEHKP
jgi:hypothetical protein